MKSPEFQLLPVEFVPLNTMVRYISILQWICVLATYFISIQAQSYRLCIVDGKGRFKKSQKYCPKLEELGNHIKCVVAVDRLDCLRRLSKGTVDFSVLTPEDLVTAENAGIEGILVTNELRFTNESYEYQVVAVINNRSQIKTKHDLNGKKFCHPGYGYESGWTAILSNFFEVSVSTPSCDRKLTLTENRIKATSDLFGSSCKAGPWVDNEHLDDILKKKYSHLCELCGEPSSCSRSDKYWGRKGSLLCLTDGLGDVSWARLDDVQQHFGLFGDDMESSPDGYSLLCPDNTLVPVNTTKPCIWVAKPWPVVASRRSVSHEVQKIVSSIRDKDPKSWMNILRYLLDTNYAEFVAVEPAIPAETYLTKAEGYLSANSFSGCHPLRTIWICTTSNVETAKCHWMKETAVVYGIEPDLDCIKADNTSHCMKAVNMNVADIVMVPSEMVKEAVSKFHLNTLFHEAVEDIDKYLTIAVTKSNVKINTWKELHGKKVCFPLYDGVAWNTVKYYLFNESLIKHCSLDNALSHFLGPSCTPNAPNSLPSHINELCKETTSLGDHAALECLISGLGEVAFVSKNSLTTYLSDHRITSSGRKVKMSDFKVNCLTDTCHLSWTTPGRAMIRNNVTDVWKKDTLDVFMRLSDLFGKNHKSTTVPFTLFGKFDEKSNILFHDATRSLLKEPTDRVSKNMPLEFDELLDCDSKCVSFTSDAPRAQVSFLLCLALFLTHPSVITKLLL